MTHNRRNSGFTLMEAVIATALFAFVVSSIVGVYISAIQLDRKTRSLRAVTQNARLISEYITKEVRNGTISYDSYPTSTVSATNSDIYITNQAGELEHIYPSSNTCSQAAPCDLKLSKDASVATNLNSSAVKITGYRVYIQPMNDPFDSSRAVNEQPRITLVMQISSAANNFSDSAQISVETTVSSRVYPVRP